MSLVALDGTPLIPMGAAARDVTGVLSTIGNAATLDATAEAYIFYGHMMTEDGASHTIDTSGSSSLGWRPQAVTFANGSSVLSVGLATMDAATGPPARATNVANVITFSVSKTMTGGGGGVTASAWNEHVPDAGTMTVANGDKIAFAIQLVTLGGADSIVIGNQGSVGADVHDVLGGCTSYLGGTYANNDRMINCTVRFSDGTYGFFLGSLVATSQTTIGWNSGSATKEYGNYFLAPFPMKIYGLYGSCDFDGNCDLVLYSDPLGTPVAEKTYTVDANTIGAASPRPFYAPFPTPYTTTANQPIAAIMKPAGTTIFAAHITLADAAHQKAYNFGSNGYAVSRASGAFAAMSSNTLRFNIGLLVGAFDNGAGGSATTHAFAF